MHVKSIKILFEKKQNYFELMPDFLEDIVLKYKRIRHLKQNKHISEPSLLLINDNEEEAKVAVQEVLSAEPKKVVKKKVVKKERKRKVKEKKITNIN